MDVIIKKIDIFRLFVIAFVIICLNGLINSAYSQLPDSTIYVWYGNLDSSPIAAHVNERISVDVYVETGPGDYVAGMLLILGANDTYIDSLLSGDEGIFYYPLTEWDISEYLQPLGSPPNPEGWSSQSIMGFASMVSPYTNPLLHSEFPIRIATMVAKPVDNTSFIGQTVEAFGPGLNWMGSSNANDSLGTIQFEVIEEFSPVYFEGNGAIGGIVFDTAGIPLENVIVELTDTTLSDTTDSQGNYLIGNLPSGTFELTFSHPEYTDITISDSVSQGITTYVDVMMYPASYGKISGTVTDTTGVVIAGVEVSVVGSQLSDTTGDDGGYLLDDIPPGTHAISFAHPDYRDTVITGIEISLEDSINLDMVLVPITSDIILLYQNYPNPCRDITTIGFYLPEPATVTIAIYDVLGRQVKAFNNISGEIGVNQILWDASDVSAGIYFYRLKYRGGKITKALIKY